MRTRVETVPFDTAIGLPGVRVQTEVARCSKCEEYEVLIPNADGLHRAIARSVLAKTERLSGAEVRFLRKVLGWSGTDFAEHMGTTAETISRWENGTAAIGPQADRLLRLMVMSRDPVEDYRKLDLLKTVARAKPATARLVAKADAKGGWNVKRSRSA